MKFEELLSLNLNGKTEKRKSGGVELTYLSWSYAVAEFTKAYPNFTYEIKMFEGKPYIYDENTGYMVFTSITAENQTKEMWLPVMDGANKAMKRESYKYVVKKKDKFTGKITEVEKTVEPASMFDVNKTIMRCLVKNMAMFGLGLYIYNGEDLPEAVTERPEEKPQPKTATIPSITPQQLAVLRGLKIQINKPLEELTFAEAKSMIENAEKLKAKKVVKKVVAQEI